MSDLAAMPAGRRPTLPPPADGRPDILVVAGEHSGDEQAARMITALRGRTPGVRVAALGGPRLEAAGAQLLHDLTGSSVVGFAEVLRHYGYFRALFAEVLRWIGAHRPRVVCLVDYPGFNLRLSAALRERGLARAGGGPIRVVYYISPQIWAWKAGRRFAMARDLDGLATLFPFEPAAYADTRLPAEFVGHPFLDPAHVAPVRHDPGGPVLLLPGSRREAVARIFPALLDGFRASGEPEAVVLYPSDAVRAVLAAAAPPANVRLQPVPRDGAKPVAAAAVLTSSGTMSLECALAGIPGAIAYRANPLTYMIGRMLVRVPYLGIANLLLREPMYPEYLQGAATAEALAAELRCCRGDPARRERTQRQTEALRALLAVPAAGDAGGWLGRQLTAASG